GVGAVVELDPCPVVEDRDVPGLEEDGAVDPVGPEPCPPVHDRDELQGVLDSGARHPRGSCGEAARQNAPHLDQVEDLGELIGWHCRTLAKEVRTVNYS